MWTDHVKAAVLVLVGCLLIAGWIWLIVLTEGTAIFLPFVLMVIVAMYQGALYLVRGY